MSKFNRSMRVQIAWEHVHTLVPHLQPDGEEFQDWWIAGPTCSQHRTMDVEGWNWRGPRRAAPLTRWVSPHRKPTNRHLHPVAIVVNDSVIKSYSPGVDGNHARCGFMDAWTWPNTQLISWLTQGTLNFNRAQVLLLTILFLHLCS
jgi:hypothetical protein